LDELQPLMKAISPQAQAVPMSRRCDGRKDMDGFLVDATYGNDGVTEQGEQYRVFCWGAFLWLRNVFANTPYAGR
jgi:hypothetical protein